ncbi:MAG: enoyl-CoA hydratase/isomerase family protein, partial [Actinomycetes bacterium]
MTVRVQRPADRIAELVLDRPEALNAISTAQAEALARACGEVAGDESLSVVVLTSSAARAFCVGADLKERAAFSDDDLRRQRPIMLDAYGGVLSLAVPTIAAVEGYALGGGAELALACDLIVASQTAVFGLPEVGVGLIPGGGGTQLLARRAGLNRAADLIFTGRQVDAEEAERLGIVDRLVPAGTARAAAVALAEQIASRSPRALRHAKAALRAGNDVDLPSGLAIENEHWQAVAF